MKHNLSFCKSFIALVISIFALSSMASAQVETAIDENQQLQLAMVEMVRVNINTAGPQMLADVLVGVGPAKAQAIIEYREQHGPFTSVEDLAKVRGIGMATIERNRQLIEL